MATRRCPKCKLINPASTRVCDCGWSFVDETMTEPRHDRGDREDEHDDRGSRSSRQIAVGVVFLVIGIIATGVTYGVAASSPSGGMFVVAYGPILFGIISIVRGLLGRDR